MVIFIHTVKLLNVRYAHFYRCLSDGITKAASSPYSKSPASVVRFENFHQLHTTLYELKVPSLDAQRKEAKRLRDENISIYVKESLGKPLEKVQNFFDAIQETVAYRGIKPEEISFQQQFSRVELKKVISQYPAKEVKKGLEQLYKKVEKHLLENSSLLQVVWREMQEQFINQLQEYQKILKECYPGANIDLEVSIDEVLRMFSEIAQQH